MKRKFYRSVISVLILGGFALSSAIWAGGCSSDPINEGSNQEVIADVKSEAPASDAGPDSTKEAMPEPVKEAMPEPVKEAMPEPIKEVMPEPIKEVVPEPIKEVMPEPIKEVMPEPIKEVMPEPIKEAKPEMAPDKSKISISFAKEIEPIFAKKCANGYCHGGGAGGLTLKSGQMYDKLVGVDSQKAAGWKRVVAGNPAKSFLYNKLSEATPAKGARMPKGGNPLPASELQKIHDWIKSGAAR